MKSAHKLRRVLKSEIFTGVFGILTLVGVTFGTVSLYQTSQNAKEQNAHLQRVLCGTFGGIGALNPAALAPTNPNGQAFKDQIAGIVLPARTATYELKCPPHQSQQVGDTP